MKTPEQIKKAHGYYKALADVTLAFLREDKHNLLTEESWAGQSISRLNSKCRDTQYALEFVMPELKGDSKTERAILKMVSVETEK